MTRRLSLAALAALSASISLASLACNKEKKDDGDAAADAAAVAPVAVADAALDTDAADSGDAGTAPLTTVVRPKATAVPVDPPICAAARTAKARGNAAAAGLEAQCKAAGGKL